MVRGRKPFAAREARGLGSDLGVLLRQIKLAGKAVNVRAKRRLVTTVTITNA